MRQLLRRLPFILAIAVFPALCLCFCQTQNPKSVVALVSSELPYDLQNPSLTIKFENEDLREVSALSLTNEKGVYLTISDESGEFFFVAGTSTGAITRRIPFRDKGDFEGAEMVGDTLWALKSDGKLFEVSLWKTSTPKVAEYVTFLKKSDDVEGLGYDAGRNALLLACKGDPDSSYLRNIYAFDLKTKQLQEKPLYSIDPKIVNRLVPYGETEKHDFFSPSAVAKHPVTGDIYVISTALKRLVTLDATTGKILLATKLDKKLLPQPEGIAFDPEGNLYISSEGKKESGRMLKFNYTKK